MNNLTLKDWLKKRDPALYEIYLAELKDRKRERARTYAQKVSKVYKQHKS